jgi:quinol monooxygenase YgiN
MSVSLVAAFVGSVVAAVGTGVLTAQCLRTLRPGAIAFALAMLGLAVALGALTLGYAVGFGPVTFRALEVGGQVVAPLAISLGLTEISAKTIPVRFTVRLILSGLAVVAFVILGTDLLNPDAAFSKAWPAATVHYELISNNLLEYGLGPVVVIIAVIAIGTAAIRSGRGLGGRDDAAPVALAGLAALALALPAMSVLLSQHLGLTLPVGSIFPVLFLAAAALTWLASARAGRLGLGTQHDRIDDEDDGWGRQEPWAGPPDHTGDFDPLGGEGVYRGGGLYRPETSQDPAAAAAYRQDDRDYEFGRDGLGGDRAGDDYGPDEEDADYADGDYRRGENYQGGFERDERDPRYPGDGYGTELPDPGYGDYADDLGGAAAVAAAGDAESVAGSGIWRAEGNVSELSENDRFGAPAGIPGAEDDAARARLFGQIAIYTLLEDRVADFDALTERVVEQVRAREPDTLVYIVHAVPSAPMQRILYEVYRDRAAYDEHRQQPYVARFEHERGPYVLATNMIELGLQQAKVSPLPSISEILGHSGLDSPAPDFVQPAPGRQSGSRLSGSGPSGSGLPGSGLPGSGLPGAGLAGYSQPGPTGAGPGVDRGEPGYSPPGYDPLGSSPARYSQPGPTGHGPGVDVGERGYSPSGDSPPGLSESAPGADRGELGYGRPGRSPSGYSPSGLPGPEFDESQRWP